MLPAKTAISIYRDNDQTVTFRVSNLEDQPYDLGGGTFRASVYSDETTIFQSVLTGEDYDEYTAYGWTFDRKTTVSLARYKNLAFRLDVIDVNGKVRTYLTGPFRLLSHPSADKGGEVYQLTVSDQDATIGVIVGDSTGDAVQARAERIAAQAAAVEAQAAADSVAGAEDALALAETSVQPDRSIIAGTGLAEGGNLVADVTLALSAASIASLAKADTAVQPGALSTVATSGSYGDLADTPTLGSAAATETTDYATAAQGTKADDAAPLSSIAAVGLSGSADDIGTGTLPDGRLSAAVAASLAKADVAIPQTRTFSAGTGLTGGGDGTADRTFALDSASQASLVLADRSRQSVASRAAIAGLSIPTGVNRLSVGGWATESDTPTIGYAYSATEPTHDAKAQSSNGRWFGAEAGATAFPSRATFAAAVLLGWKTAPGHVSEAEGLKYIATTGAAVAGLPAGWLPVAPVNVRHFGAVLDDSTDNELAFERADAYGVYPIQIDGPAFLSTAPNPRWGQYQLVGATAAVDQNGASFLPSYKDVVNGNNHYITRSLIASQDPSPTITGAEYPILDEAPARITRHYNFWGAQHETDINGAGTGRTGLYQERWIFSHQGEGDFYSWLSSGTVIPHPRASEITATKGHNNGGIGGGQISAAGDRVTLYGIGDIDLKDQGFDNVSMRGLVVHLDKAGDDNAYAYRADTFGLRVYSREAEAVGNAINIQGPMEVGLSLTRAELSSDNVLISMGEGQKISFDDDDAQPSNSYNPLTFGTYWITKTATDVLEIAANGGKLDVGASQLVYTPASPAQYSFRIASGTADVYAAMGAAGSVAYFSAIHNGTGNTSVSIRTSQSGAETDRVTVTSSGHMNLVSGQFQMAGTAALVRGAGSPEGVLTAGIGTIYLRTDGGAGTAIYIKESGTGNTGWVAK